MSEKSGRLKQQASYQDPLLLRVFNILFAAFFAVVVLVAVFHNRGTDYEMRWYWMLVAGLLGMAAFWLAYKLLSMLRQLDGTINNAVVAILFVVFAAVQVYVGWSLRVAPSQTWDFGVVYSHAEDYVLQGILPGDYFLNFSNNTGLYLFWVGFMSVLHMFGMQDFVPAAFALNIISIDLSIYILYRCGLRLFGQKKALVLLLASFATLPFLLYVPVFYTDTLSLVFPIGAVSLWLSARREWRGGNKNGSLKYFCLLSLLLGVGALLKVTVLIVWVAAAIDLLLLLSGKGKAKLLLAGLAIALAIFMGGSWLMRQSNALPEYDYNGGIPFTHWIMMGLNTNGDYSNDDYELTLAAAADKAGRMSFNMEKIGERISDKGFFGMLSHLADKLGFTFGDGSYTAFSKLDRSPVEVNRLHQFVVHSGAYIAFTAYFAFAVQFAMLVGMIVAAVGAVRRRNECLTFVRIAVFGLVLFLLVWETRGRYLVNFLPLMLLCAVEAFPLERPARVKGSAVKGKEPANGGTKGKAAPKGKAAGKKKAEKQELLPVQPSAHFKGAEAEAKGQDARAAGQPADLFSGQQGAGAVVDLFAGGDDSAPLAEDAKVLPELMEEQPPVAAQPLHFEEAELAEPQAGSLLDEAADAVAARADSEPVEATLAEPLAEGPLQPSAHKTQLQLQEQVAGILAGEAEAAGDVEDTSVFEEVTDDEAPEVVMDTAEPAVAGEKQVPIDATQEFLGSGKSGVLDLFGRKAVRPDRAQGEKVPVQDDLFSSEGEEPIELFDVPKGDPFFDLARTNQWSVEDLFEEQRRREEEGG